MVSSVSTMAQDWDYTIYTSDKCDKEFNKTVFINGQPVSILMDTSAQVNVLPYGLLHDVGIQPTEIMGTVSSKCGW